MGFRIQMDFSSRLVWARSIRQHRPVWDAIPNHWRGSNQKNGECPSPDHPDPCHMPSRTVVRRDIPVDCWWVPWRSWGWWIGCRRPRIERIYSQEGCAWGQCSIGFLSAIPGSCCEHGHPRSVPCSATRYGHKPRQTCPRWAGDHVPCMHILRWSSWVLVHWRCGVWISCTNRSGTWNELGLR